MIAKPRNSTINPQNLSINNLKYVETSDDGCYLKGNLIRIGFASDYNIIFKQKITPIIENKIAYNYYAHLNCYSENCFVENTKLNIEHDLYEIVLKDPQP